ncbi:MAG: DNA-3-methyladenine glycosylase family protein [Acidimicrobiales bacterium]
MPDRLITLPFPIDVRATLWGVRRGRHDPSHRFGPDGIWRASRTPAGPATVRLVVADDQVTATAWGEGAEAALDAVPELIGCHDDDGGFSPDHGVLARLWRDFHQVRVPRSGAVSATLIQVVLEQRVTTFEARRAQTQIARRWGEAAPGPIDLRLPADPRVLAGIGYYDLHVVGVEKKRADTVRRVAANAHRLDALVDVPVPEAHRRLQEIVGVGPWSAAETALVALGDTDAVPVGDLHLPSQVTYALTGTPVDDDDAMLEVLEPYAGQRGRVIRLIMAAGIQAPRRTPRHAPRDIRSD